MTWNLVTTCRLRNTDINKLREEMYAYHTTEVHLNLCSGHNLNASTSVIYLFRNWLANYILHISCRYNCYISTHAGTCVHVHIHTHYICIWLTYRLINKFKNSSTMHYSQFLFPRNTPVINEMMYTYHTASYKIIQKWFNQTPMTSHNYN